MSGPFVSAIAAGALVALSCWGCTPEPSARINQRTLLTFGTIIDIEAVGEPRATERALDAVEAYFDRLHVDWYAFGAGELGRVNEKLRGGSRAVVSPELAALLRRALALRDASLGMFDPAVGDLVELWGFGDQRSLRTEPPAEEDIRAWLDNATFRYGIELRGDNTIVVQGPVVLDFSAMAKGAALEGAAKLLREHGIENAVIDAGGDIKVLGEHPDRPWRIGIRHPRDKGILAAVTMRPGEAIVSSGDYQRYFDYGDRRFHHVIDPRSGRPTTHAVAVTVIAGDAALADAAATALMVAGPSQFRAIAEALGVDAALLVRSDGGLVMTAAMESRLAPR